MLIDAQDMATRFPEFEAPGAESLSKIMLGDYIKVCAHGERFWVMVLATEADFITGKIDSVLLNPLNRSMWTCGDTIVLERRHVFDVQSTQDRDAFTTAFTTNCSEASGDVIVHVDDEINRLTNGDELYQKYVSNSRAPWRFK